MYIATHSVMNQPFYPRISPELALFMTVWANASDVAYDDRWVDSTQYFVKATEIFTTKNLACSDPDDRRVLIVPDGETSLVIFERYPAGGEFLFARAPKDGRAIAGIFRTDRPDLLEIVDRLETQIRERRLISGTRYS